MAVLLVLLIYLLIAWDPPKILFGIFFITRYLGQQCGCDHILLKEYPYAKLKNLGVNLWLPRKPAVGIIPERIRIAARCLVLVHLPAGDASAEEQKIFTGMVGVLACQATDYAGDNSRGQPAARVTCCGNSALAARIYSTIKYGLPEMLWQNLVRTYSPAYLLRNPQYKSQAYKTLLASTRNASCASKSNRKMSYVDIPAVFALDHVVDPTPWSDKLLNDCVRVGYDCWVIAKDEELLGYGIVSYAANEAHLLKIAIAPEYQRKAGAKAATTFNEHGENQGRVEMFLEVRISNAEAISLYAKIILSK